MESIHLRGGDVHITNDSAMAYEVVQGHVLVYLFPYRKGKSGRKLFLLEAVPGEMLPSLCSETDHGILVYLIRNTGLTKLLAELCILRDSDSAVACDHNRGSVLDCSGNLLNDRLF